MAWISHEHELIFLHNPKTGGVSIGHALEEHGFVRSWNDKQWNSEVYQHNYEIPDEFSAYSVFCVWRNPYARAVSWWKFLQQREKKVDPGVGFAEFLSDRHWMHPETYDIRWDTRMQYPFLDRADIILAFEDLQRGIELPGLGKLNLPLLNQSAHTYWWEYYSDWCYGFVEGFYGRDFDAIQKLCGEDLRVKRDSA